MRQTDIVIRRTSPDDVEAVGTIYAHHVQTGVATFELTAPDATEWQRRMHAITGDVLPFLTATMDGRVAGYAIGMWERGSSAAAGALARYRERARARERISEARLAEANRQAGTRPPQRRSPPGRPRPQGPQRPTPVNREGGAGGG